jgi:hypothetical protein
MTAGPHRKPFDQYDNQPSQLSVGERRISLQQAERMRVRDERERRHAALLGDLSLWSCPSKKVLTGILRPRVICVRRPAPTPVAAMLFTSASIHMPIAD